MLKEKYAQEYDDTHIKLTDEISSLFNIFLFITVFVFLHHLLAAQYRYHKQPQRSSGTHERSSQWATAVGDDCL